MIKREPGNSFTGASKWGRSPFAQLPVLLLALTFALPQASLAAPTHSRFAISLSPQESPYEAAAAFELACLRVNQKVRRVRPVQRFEFAKRQFVRLQVEAEQPHRCLAGLPQGRAGVDGSFRWFDGFEGGLLVEGSSPADPALDEGARQREARRATPELNRDQERSQNSALEPELNPELNPDLNPDPNPDLTPDPKHDSQSNADGKEDRIPDSIWFHPNAQLPRPKLDSEFTTALAQGSQQAVENLEKLPFAEQWAALEGLALRQGAAVQVALERVAASGALWTVRRAALMALDPKLAWGAVLKAAKDPHPGMRLSALPYLAYYDDGIVAGAPGAGKEAWELLEGLFRSDPSWSIRRAVLFSLSIAQARKHASTLKKRMKSDDSGLVAAAALEVLDASGELGRSEIRELIDDPRRPVHLAAISALSRQMSAQDAPLLWEKFISPIPEQAHAAVSFLHLIDDDSIRPALWPLYLREAERLDPELWYLETMLDYIQRHPPENAPQLLFERLQTPISPNERRLVARVFAALAPEAAESLFLSALDSPDAAERALAADVLPDSSQIRERRLALLDSDPDSDVRAAALIGLCRSPGQEADKLLSRAMLQPSALANEAMAAFQRCGQPPLKFQRIKTQLLGPSASEAHGNSGWEWLAFAGVLLLLGSVLGEKLKKPSESEI